MSYPGFARPDLCSIRTVDEQEELAEAVRSGFNAVSLNAFDITFDGRLSAGRK